VASAGLARVMIAEIAVIAVLGGSPRGGGRCDVPRARERPRGRDLAPTFMPAAVHRPPRSPRSPWSRSSAGPPRGGRCDVPQARERPRGRDLAPTFTSGAILSSGTSTLGRTC